MPKLNQRGVVHFLLPLILLVGIAVGVYLVTSGNPLKLFSKAFLGEQSVEALTEQLIELNEPVEGRSVQEDKTGQMLAVASKRKDRLLEELDKDPKVFLKHAQLTKKRDSFPEAVRDLIEQDRQLSGYLTVIHADSSIEKKSYYGYTLTTEDSRSYELFFTEDSPDLLSSPGVSIEGVELGSRVALQSYEATKDLQAASRSALSNTFGDQTLLVMLVNFTDFNPQPFSKDEIKSVLFDRSREDSLVSYYEANSLNQMTVSGIVTDWLTITASTGSCAEKTSNGRVWLTGLWDWTLKADEAAARSGIDVKSFNRLVYIFPEVSSCKDMKIDGAGSLGGTYAPDEPGRPDYNPSRSWITNKQLDPRIYEHELGHNLGVDHANALFCGKLEIDSYDKCTSYEYGDPTDIMGDYYNYKVSGSYHFNAPHKAAMGWVDKSITTVPLEDATFTLTPPLENPGSKLQVVKLPKPDTNEYYYLSYRQPLGSDKTMSGEFTRGVTIHIAKDTKLDNLRRGQTQLITVLTDNQWFYDSINKLAIRQIRHNKSSVSFEVRVNQEVDPSTIPPIPKPTPAPLPSGDNWGVATQLVCQDNKALTKEEATRTVYAIWPDEPYDLSNPLKFVRTEYSYQDPDPQIISIKNKLSVSGAYVGVETESGEFLTPIGKPPHNNITYSKFFGINMARWNKGGVPADYYTFQFQAPGSWCK